jgi:hypothetical protein
MADEAVLRDKAQILARMAESRRALQSALDRLTPETMSRPGTWGEHSVKDLLAHITYWHTVAIDRLQKFADGRMDEIRFFNDDEIDEVNENVYRANKDRPLDEITDAFASTYLALRTAAKSIPPSAYLEDQTPSPLRNWVVGNGSAHYEEHLPDIQRAATST